MVRSPSAANNKSPSAAAFQSHPTDLELVNSYLRPWVETGLKAGPFIHEADVYAADPADLTRQFAPAVAEDGERAWYFFTPLRHKSVRGKRKARTVATGGGCWHNEAKSKPVCTRLNGKVQIGHRQSFSFVNKEGGQRVRTGWLMMELRLLREGAGQADDAVGNLVLCKVYRSPRNPEPVDREAEPKAEAADGDGESSGATAEDNDDDGNSSDEPQAPAAAASGPEKKSEDDKSSEATVAAPSRHSKADDEISGAAAAPGRKDKAAGDEDSAETSAAAPARKRKAPEDENSGAAAAEAAPAPKRTADGSSSPGAPAPPATEMQCPHCGTHLVVTLKRPETKSATEIAKGEPAPGASDAPTPGGESRGSSEKNIAFHQFL